MYFLSNFFAEGFVGRNLKYGQRDLLGDGLGFLFMNKMYRNLSKTLNLKILRNEKSFLEMFAVVEIFVDESS